MVNDNSNNKRRHDETTTILGAIQYNLVCETNTKTSARERFNPNKPEV